MSLRRKVLLIGLILLVSVSAVSIFYRTAMARTVRLRDGSSLAVLAVRKEDSGTIYYGNLLERTIGRFLPRTGIRVFGKAIVPLCFRFSNPKPTNNIALVLHHSNIPEWTSYKGVPRRKYVEPDRYFALTDSKGNYMWTLGGAIAGATWKQEEISVILADINPSFGDTFGLEYYEKTETQDVLVAKFQLNNPRVIRSP